ncbi:MAG: CDP-glucose 4,6-dehydratase [Syntrophomonadaceae bacterium]|nr:CDP-glucose 4,6-dehydratase [Syntrophomonadaceae bacterium]
MLMFEDVFRGKRVFITGDTGFKGSWLSLWLTQMGAEVRGFALPPERENDHFILLGLDKLINHINGDIRDYDQLKNAVGDFKPQIVFHLAAQPLVRYSYEEPKLTFDTNISGSVNVLEAIRNCPEVKALIYITSDKCYKNKEWIWGYRENDELGGHDPYSASKAAAELVFSSYMSAYLNDRVGFGAASVRAGNVIGGGDWAQDRIVPDSMKALMDREPIVLRNPRATRPWQHVLEPLFGYLMLAARLYEDPKSFSGSWNFGPTAESVRNVRCLADKIVQYWGEGIITENKEANASHEAGLLHLNSDKANYVLGWNPGWDFERTVYKTVEWYKGYQDGKNILDLSRQHIDEYWKTQQDKEVARH